MSGPVLTMSGPILAASGMPTAGRQGDDCGRILCSIGNHYSRSHQSFADSYDRTPSTSRVAGSCLLGSIRTGSSRFCRRHSTSKLSISFLPRLLRQAGRAISEPFSAPDFLDQQNPSPGTLSRIFVGKFANSRILVRAYVLRQPAVDERQGLETQLLVPYPVLGLGI
jgi:hypothetical protein